MPILLTTPSDDPNVNQLYKNMDWAGIINLPFIPPAAMAPWLWGPNESYWALDLNALAAVSSSVRSMDTTGEVCVWGGASLEPHSKSQMF